MAAEDLEDEELFEDLELKPIKTDEQIYVHVVSNKFYQIWKETKSEDALQKVGNGDIEGEIQGTLKPGIVYDSDYHIFTNSKWDLIASFCKPAFRRKIIKKGVKGRCFCELYPIPIKCFFTDEKGNLMPEKFEFHYVSKTESLQNFVEKLQISIPAESRAIEVEAGKPLHMRLWKPTSSADLGGEWTLLDDDELAEKMDKHLPSQLVRLMLEIQNGDGTWKRMIPVREWGDFHVNDRIDAKDSEGKWYESVIRDVKEQKIFVHFCGLPTKWDEWIERSSDRLAKKGTHSDGPYKPKNSALSNFYSQNRRNERDSPLTRGVVGLHNLGNTCYMNSALQCILQMPILGDYFVDGAFLSDINRKNPLGWQGQVADTFGEFLQTIYSDKYSKVAPKAVKDIIGQVNSQFSGFQQHDSQEFLSFLLDALHEDLNRVAKKALTQEVEGRDRPDEEVALESWQNHLKRHDSQLLDILCGQFRSHIVCPDCKLESKKFDPFWMISVPLPCVKEKVIEVTWLGGGNDAFQLPIVLGLTLDIEASMLDVKKQVAKFFNIEGIEDLYACDIWQNRVYRMFGNKFSICDLQGNDTLHLSYAENHFTNEDETEFTIAYLNHFEEKKKKNASETTYGAHLRHSPKNSPLCIPQFIKLPISEEISLENMHILIVRTVKHLFKDTKIKEEEIDLSELCRIIQQDKSGRSCYKCEWLENCQGCEINESLKISKAAKILSINVYWNEKGLELINFDALANPARHSSALEETTGNSSPSDPAISLTDCLDLFTEEEILDDLNAWFCPNCKDFKCAQKQMDLWKVPDVCIIHLKRFSTYREKNNRDVNYPLTLDLKKWIKGPENEVESTEYDLFGVVHHIGVLGGGHYVATIKAQSDEQWYQQRGCETTRL